MRVFWRVLGSVLAVSLLAFGVPEVVSVLAHHVTAFQSQFSTVGLHTLEIDSDSGSVRIIGSALPSSLGEVTTLVSDGLLATTHHQRRVGDRLVLTASCPTLWSAFCSVDYVVAVPSSVSVIVHTDNGSIRAQDLRAGADLETDNSSITVDHLSGSVTLSTDNGDVTGSNLGSRQVVADTDNGSITLTLAAVPDSVRSQTDNGSITMVVPDTTDAYRLDVGTSQGSVTTPVRTDPTAPRVLSAHTDNGDVTITYPGH